MKKFTIIALAAMAVLASCSKDDEVTPTVTDYTLRTLTFEDSDYAGGLNYAGGTNWSSLIDTPEYGGSLLYDTDEFTYASSSTYRWCDENNTELITNELEEYIYYGYSYGTSYSSGGIAVSNYYKATTSTGEDNIGSNNQLSVPYIKNSYSGYNGSTNFAVVYGDASLTFSDEVARVIDHMYICATTYTIDSAIKGDGYYVDAFDSSDWASVYVTGYDIDGNETGTLEYKLVDGTKALSSWAKWNLSSLGEVKSISFSFDSSDHSTYDDSSDVPNYVAIDNIAVRF